jgi:hypothetical protein
MEQQKVIRWLWKAARGYVSWYSETSPDGTRKPRTAEKQKRSAEFSAIQLSPKIQQVFGGSGLY